MGTKSKGKTRKIARKTALPTIDLTEYEFIYKSEPTFVVPLIDFISGLAPLQPPIAKKEELEQNKGRSRLMQEFLSHELVEAFSFNPAKLSKKIRDLGSILGFQDNVDSSVLHDAGIKLNRFYWLVYLTYALTCLLFILGFVYWFFIVPSVPPLPPPSIPPTATPIASPTTLPSASPTTSSSGSPTAASSVSPTEASSASPTTPPLASPTAPPTASPTAPPNVAPIRGVDIKKLFNFSVLFAPISTFFGLIFIFIVIRLGILIVGRRYASTLCLLACIYITLELEQDDILSIDRIKNRLLHRIDFLARYIPLIGLNLSGSDPSVRTWTLQYFRTVQKYIHQLERLVIAPKSDTLQVLRKDFYTMAGILLHGNYDEIDWATATSHIEEKPQTTGQRIGSLIQGFVSTGIPILLILVVIVFPDLHLRLGVENRVISLIAIAWFLIAVDVNLRLGVIERILDIAKAIRELT